jgi:hypothetical protein
MVLVDSPFFAFGLPQTDEVVTKGDLRQWYRESASSSSKQLEHPRRMVPGGVSHSSISLAFRIGRLRVSIDQS